MNLLEFHQIFDQSILTPMKAEDMTVADVWAGSMIKPIPRVLPAVPYQWQDGTAVLITGDPFAWAAKLDSRQGGDNAWNVDGTCACTAVSNVCKMAGMNVQEPDVVNLSISSGMSDPKKRRHDHRRAAQAPCALRSCFPLRVQCHRQM